jgi:hypothetical protein
MDIHIGDRIYFTGCIDVKNKATKDEEWIWGEIEGIVVELPNSAGYLAVTDVFYHTWSKSYPYKQVHIKDIIRREKQVVKYLTVSTFAGRKFAESYMKNSESSFKIEIDGEIHLVESSNLRLICKGENHFEVAFGIVGAINDL